MMETLDNILSVYVTLPYFDMSPDQIRDSEHTSMKMPNGLSTSMPMILSAIEAAYTMGKSDGLSQAQSKKRSDKVWTFRVTGTGRFPYDMLRHDCCWPESASDLEPGDSPHDYREPRSYKMVTRLPSGPTVQRWRSFGWSVDEEECSF